MLFLAFLAIPRLSSQNCRIAKTAVFAAVNMFELGPVFAINQKHIEAALIWMGLIFVPAARNVSA